MLADAKVSMRKFQFWTLISFVMMYFWLAPSFMKDNSPNVRIVILVVSFLIALIAGYHILRIVQQSGNGMSPENLTEEEKVELYMVGFGAYLTVLGSVVFMAVIFKLNLAYKFFFYQMIMGMAYFQQKRNILNHYRKHNNRTDAPDSEAMENIAVQEQSKESEMEDEL